uniref:hypothetical protein n=1 Tax=Pararhizobium sp. IMCC3301 TaxID=3067904 RepID=UPI002740AA07|nr:hypothetical protein [Pararhizobium sp. IMCC3301]
MSAQDNKTAWPRWLTRGPMETLATVLIALGFIMMFQPYLKVLYTYSFITLLAGTVMFIIVSKFPEANDG